MGKVEKFCIENIKEWIDCVWVLCGLFFYSKKTYSMRQGLKAKRLNFNDTEGVIPCPVLSFDFFCLKKYLALIFTQTTNVSYFPGSLSKPPTSSLPLPTWCGINFLQAKDNKFNDGSWDRRLAGDGGVVRCGPIIAFRADGIPGVYQRWSTQTQCCLTVNFLKLLLSFYLMNQRVY